VTACIWEGQAIQSLAWQFGEGAQLATIGKKIVQGEHRNRGGVTT
jgi:hypothetical protein